MNELAVRVERRDKISRLEGEMRKHEQLPIEPRHYFANGIYAREITIPAGALLTGEIHKTEHLNIISKGRIIVYTEFGEHEICAPCTMVSAPGTKRVGLVLEETVWTTIHGTHEKDLDKLRLELIVESYTMLDREEMPWLG
jgi:hypothetical protein